MEVLSPGTCEGDSIRNGVFADVVSRDEVALEQGRLVSGEERASNKDPGKSCDDGDRGRSDTSTGPGVPRSAGNRRNPEGPRISGAFGENVALRPDGRLPA